MPDLSKRPARYATALVVAVLAGGYAVNAAPVRFGPDPAVAGLRAENARLKEQQREPATTTTGTAPAAVRRNCSSFANQEAAQVFWAANRVGYPDWDGNHNGIVCEQLKPTKPATVRVTKLLPGATVRHESTHQTTVVETRTQTGARGTPDQRAAAPAGPAPAPAPEPAPEPPSAPGPGSGPTPPVEALPPAPPVRPRAPAKATILAATKNFGLYAATNEEYAGIEAAVNRDTTIHGYFQGWDSPFEPARVNSAWAHGQLPMLTWESRGLTGKLGPDQEHAFGLDGIAAGAFDGYVRQYAKDIRANGLPLAIRLDHEMNGNWYPWCEPNPAVRNSAGSYVRAWRHVHDVFAAEGAADLVVWVWSPNRVDPLSRNIFLPIDHYYPGADYVDWVGMSGYYREGEHRPGFGRTFDKTFAALRQTAPGKRILLTEVGATATSAVPTRKLDWVRSFLGGLPANPDVIGFVWFNYAITKAGATNDWRLDDDPAVRAAFRAGVAEVGFGRPHGAMPTW